MATLPTTADFHAMFDTGEPAFAAVGDAVITAKIAYAATWVAADIWDQRYSEGVLLRAAHELCFEQWLAQLGGSMAAAREFERKSVGGASFSRGTALAREAADHLSRTIYGQKWVQLARIVARGPLVSSAWQA